MDYLYENLGDERFQEFCSCLISKEFQNIQTYPVGQPDGGRDSLAYLMNSNEKEFIVFQVKFVRNANEEKDIHKWLIETIENEAEKIDKLIPKGAIKYYLLTNVKGTAHLDAGSKDKINKILEEKVKIPSLCWWRDDLSRLFEKDPLFKWSYPEILNGQDILNSVLFEGLNENRERRENVIRAYLIDQFEMDNEVKFKQIDLQNRLLNLYTDVPLQIKKYNAKNKELKRILDSLDFEKVGIICEDNYTYEERNKIGAAEFLLHPKIQNNIGKVLLEGGPGQGKSTISQYICQVHRARLLNKQADIDLIPEKIRKTPVRLPFKIDLRDIASWVEKKNPYLDTVNQELFERIWNDSLESFLICHIFYHSKIEEFTSNDLITICKLSPILFVFDGFDEIANIKVRADVIEFINKGISRLSISIKSIQVIITSRPAAFTDSVGFSIDHYPHFELIDITPNIINEYVEKWIKERKLNNRSANELKRLIKEKLEMPHLKDLAKSPMQLAIFISLLNTKGQSLPNKRTALYDSYIELVFDRESEKNTLIRDKRDLIIDIHQYLAWILHSEAELYKNSGRINISDLKTRLKDYLTKEGHDTSIADKLFDVMKERVCALVSRIQGTFEFEVQPLREYFCAKYLYESAPHSSAGSIKNGTKPERLHAILRNYYWQNVVRFFAGCADAGELDMIIQELKELQNDDLLKYTNYPRILTSQILSDYVFTQKPLKLKDVVKIIVDGINIGNIINQDARYNSNESLLLPDECGRIDIINECFLQLIKFPNNDYANELIGILNNNSQNNLDTWLKYVVDFSNSQLTKWLEYAYKLQLIHRINEEQLLKIIKEGDDTQIVKRLQLILNCNRIELLDKNIELKQMVFNGILNTELNVFQGKKFDHSFNFLSLILHPFFLNRIFERNDSNLTFINHIGYYIRFQNSKNSLNSISEFDIIDDIDKTIKDFSNLINSIFNIPISKFKNSLEPWDILVENGRTLFKDNWSLFIIANIAAGIKSKEETFENFADLNDTSLSLCKRVRYARQKSGNIKYWEQQLAKSSNILFTLLVFFTWATPKTIIQLLPKLSLFIKSLDINDFSLLTKAIFRSINNSSFDKIQQKYIESEMNLIDNEDEIKYILSLRFNNEKGHEFIYKFIKNNKDDLKGLIEKKFNYLLNLYIKEPHSTTLLTEIKELYINNFQYDERFYYRNRTNEFIKIPYEIAKIIMNNCKEYPSIISSLAEKSCRLYANEHLVPIGEIANRDKWFDEN